jgi:hypothetical protein
MTPMMISHTDSSRTFGSGPASRLFQICQPTNRDNLCTSRWRAPVASLPAFDADRHRADSVTDRFAGQSLARPEAFPLHLHRTVEDRYGRSSATRWKPPSSPETPMVTVLPMKHAREISLSLHPSIKGRFAVPSALKSRPRAFRCPCRIIDKLDGRLILLTCGAPEISYGQRSCRETTHWCITLHRDWLFRFQIASICGEFARCQDP